MSHRHETPSDKSDLVIRETIERSLLPALRRGDLDLAPPPGHPKNGTATQLLVEEIDQVVETLDSDIFFEARELVLRQRSSRSPLEELPEIAESLGVKLSSRLAHKVTTTTNLFGVDSAWRLRQHWSCTLSACWCRSLSA